MAKKVLTLKTLTKNNVWDVQENDILRMFESAEKEPDYRDNFRRYIDIVRFAFTVETLDDSQQLLKGRYEKEGYMTGHIRLDNDKRATILIKKRPIARVSDLTYENIHHITAAKLIEVIDRNFGGGWDSLSQSVKDIIESGFDISTTTLPKDRLHKAGGMYEKKVTDGYEVLEIPKGTWVEAIFAKTKPEVEKPRLQLTMRKNDDDQTTEEESYGDGDNEPAEPVEPAEIGDEDITEENYRTTFEIEEDPDEESEDMSDFRTDD